MKFWHVHLSSLWPNSLLHLTDEVPGAQLP